MEDRWHIIGTGDNPILICRKGEVPKLLTPDFWYCFEFWQMYHYRLLPQREINEATPDLLKTVMYMESHFRNHFSMHAVNRQYSEAIIKRMDIYFGGKQRQRGRFR